MKFPKFLPKNGTIGFVAPSFGCNIEPYHSAFKNAQKKFKTMGYTLDLGPNCYLGEGIGISNTPEKCAAEFMDYYLSPQNDVLISCGGGELMCEILEHLDSDKLKNAQPKWFMGFSDNTNLTFLLTTCLDIASIYAPCAATYGMEPWHESLHDAFNLLKGQKLCVHGYDLWEKESLKDAAHPLLPYNPTEKKVIKTYPDNEGNFSGRLIGGCLDCLSTLVGTQFDQVKSFNEKYANDGLIWYLEACDLNVMSIRRAIWQLDQAGWFKEAKGFLIGRPYNYDQPFLGLDQYEAVLGILRKYHVPVLMDVDLGHLPPMMPIINGSLATVEFKQNEITIDMQLK